MAGERARRGPVLVAGAGGFLGRAIVQALVEGGWVARGLTRSPDGLASVERLGGEPVAGDVLDAAVVRAAAAECQAIVHVAANPGDEHGDPELPHRVRVEGCRNLADAARLASVPTLVVGSGYWVYADQPGPIREESRVDPQGESRTNYETELLARTFTDLDVRIVRPGMVYGDGSWLRSTLTALRDHSYRVIGSGSNAWSFVSLPDLGRAFRTVLEAGAPGNVYNVVDDEPRPWGEFAAYLADRIGCDRPASCSTAEAERIYGPVVARHLAAARATSSEKLQRLGWRPVFSNYRPGIDDLLARISPNSDPTRGPPAPR